MDTYYDDKFLGEDVKKILNKESRTLVEELWKCDSGYDNLLNGNLVEYEVGIILNILSKAVNSANHHEKLPDLILKTFRSFIFCKNLKNFLWNMRFSRSLKSIYLPSVISILKYFVTLVPPNVYVLISNITYIIEGSLKRFCSRDSSYNNLRESFQKLNSVVSKVLDQNQICVDESDMKCYLSNEEIIPSIDELNGKVLPLLTPAIVVGKYENLEHYLRVQFQLLKEDFIRPLREGLRNYKANIRNNLDFRIYHDVKFNFFDYINNVLYLDLPNNIGNIEDTKRFMFGNLFLMSIDNFNTMIVATIHDLTYLKQRIIGVKPEQNLLTPFQDKTFTVIEPKALFIPYRHSLKALKLISNLPLEDYIVRAQENRTTPDYISPSTKYNLIPLENDISILEPTEFWYSSNNLNLNDSQRRALYAALTKKMAIIQGPPGTGKSFIGLKIVEILLRNKKIWRNGKSSPILVLCYTNHALDQFLEGMLNFTSNICRVGSRSKCKALEGYLVKSLRYNYNFLNYLIRPARQIYSECNSLKEDIEKITTFLEEMNSPGIISLTSFTSTSIIPSNVFSFLRQFSMRAFLSDDFNNKLLFENMIITPDFEENSYEYFDKDSSEDLDLEDENTSHEECNPNDNIKSNSFSNSLIYDVSNLDYDITSYDFECTIKVFELNLKKQKNPVIKRYYAEELKNIKNELKNIEKLYQIPYNSTECRNDETFVEILSFNTEERWRLYRYWTDKLRHFLQEKRSLLQAKHQKLLMRKSSYQDFLKIDMLKSFDVIGMTTTGATLNLHILQDLDPPIVIIEEAAEVLETHLVASLPPNCKHLIMIGDHKQLRPKPNVYELGKKYNLDISFFERMIRNDIQYETLECQHRMKPIISDLLVPTIYEKLENHESVYAYPKIKGLKKDLFFIDHNIHESQYYDMSESFENFYEATFLFGICRHLLYQGYDISCITILTPYTGQLKCFNRVRKMEEFNMCYDVKIRVLDDYQGEENDIILLSLVRSNSRGQIGFMKIENRINVALSRAKHGMYIIGNMTQMAEQSETWKKIREKLINGNNIGSRLELQCEVHPSETLVIKCFEEFEIKSPNGGCTLPCELRFPSCEHKCPNTCHASHQNVKCKFPCSKLICDQQHPCSKLCFEKCGKCRVLIEKMLPCGHLQPVKCSTPIENVNCPKLVSKEMPSCKHIIDVLCHIKPENFQCTANCDATLNCGHQCERLCHPDNDVNHLKYNCKLECNRYPSLCEFNHKCIKKCHEECGSCTVLIVRVLECGHVMNNIQCGILVKDIKCDTKCQRILNCGHACPSLCGEECGECTESGEKVFPNCNHKIQDLCVVLKNLERCPMKCDKFLPCGHICKNLCGETCGNCLEKVDKLIPECNHIAKVPCSLSPSIEYCYGKCKKTLTCGHQCRKKCNETCTSNCKELVQNLCSRKHNVLIKCHISQEVYNTNISLTRSKMLIGKYCTETCRTILNCGHLCEGNCNDCFNGRIHLSCLEACSKILVCGHICKSPCIVDCPPCKTDILWKCSHKEVTQRCGSQKYICKEPCERGCIHTRCTAKCGSECNIKPCNEACTKVLSCGHKCIGFCGEICPSFCRICDKGKLFKLSESENIENLKFVELEDCEHLFEASLLDNYMKLPVNHHDSDLLVKICPKCKVPIHNTQRYKHIVSNCYKNVLKCMSIRMAKRKSLDTKGLIRNLKELYPHYYEEVSLLLDLLCCDNKFVPGRYICQEELVLYNLQLKFLKDAKKLKKGLSYEIPYLKGLIESFMQHNLAISKQTMDEIYKELRRIEIIFHYEKFKLLSNEKKKKVGKTDDVTKALNHIDCKMISSLTLNKDSEKYIKDLLIKLNAIYCQKEMKFVFL